MTTDKDQTLDLFAQLNDADALEVLEFAKMRLFAQLMQLQAEDIPSIDEWENTPLVVRRLLVIAVDRQKLIRYVSN
jgi:hypothetical protein